MIRLFIGYIILSAVFYNYYLFQPKGIRNIHELIITQPLTIIIVFIVGLTSIISSLLFFRLNNLGQAINLLNIYEALYLYITNTDKYIILANIIYFTSILLLLLRIIFYFNNYIFKQFNKIHIYLRNKQFYMDKIIRKFFYPYYRGPIEKLKVIIIKRIYGKFILTGAYSSIEYGMFAKRFNYLDSYTLFIENHLSLILICISVTYDLIFNALILTKIYYIFPVVFLYLTWQTLVRFYTQRDIHLDSRLALLLYNENDIKITIDIAELQNIQQYILNNFKYTNKDND